MRVADGDGRESWTPSPHWTYALMNSLSNRAASRTLTQRRSPKRSDIRYGLRFSNSSTSVARARWVTFPLSCRSRSRRFRTTSAFSGMPTWSVHSDPTFGHCTASIALCSLGSPKLSAPSQERPKSPETHSPNRSSSMLRLGLSAGCAGPRLAGREVEFSATIVYRRYRSLVALVSLRWIPLRLRRR